VIPTGRQSEIVFGDYAAIVTEVGAHLRSLTYRGRPLVAAFEEHKVPIAFEGAVLAPWPNRLADGRYRVGSDEFQVDLSEPKRHNALHGLVNWAGWRIDEADAAGVLLTHRLWPRTGYPFLLDLSVGYRLGPDGLTFTLSATNAGDTTAPYGGSWHPYLVAGDGSVDSWTVGAVDGWTVRSPAGRYLAVDTERLLPLEIVPLGEFDFREGASLLGIEVDHAFTDIAFDDAGAASVVLTDGNGVGTVMTWDDRCRWLQLCIPDANNPRLERRALAVEPMTCPPDAFNSGIDLVMLAPAETHSFDITIGAVG
jgi:aldose 1-epimerase